jgi:uncharacterized membrane protein
MADAKVLDTERLLGRVLTVGTRASSLCLAAGLVLALVSPSRRSGALLHVGLIILMATPMLRVIVSIGAFSARREWRFVVFTSLVLVLLIVSILVALAA